MAGPTRARSSAALSAVAIVVGVLLLAVLVLAGGLSACGRGQVASNSTISIVMPSTTATAGAPVAEPQTDDEVFAEAFAGRQSGLEVQGRGTVQRILPDDADGDRHQRFIVGLESGQTLLIAHNIDVAPRVPGLKAGDSVSFKGQYEWSQQGGTVHWTHHDPDGSHAGGWIEYSGERYE